MFYLRIFSLQISIGLLMLCIACNSSTPKSETLPIDSSVKQIPEETLVNDEPPQPPVRLPLYDGTAETARKQIDEYESN